jgi:hypothetical protein
MSRRGVARHRASLGSENGDRNFGPSSQGGRTDPRARISSLHLIYDPLPIISGMRFRLVLPILCCLAVYGQQTPPDSSQPRPAPKVSATTRLLNAKTVFVKNIAGSDIPFDIVNNAIIGWPRYMVVDASDKADLLIEISSPEGPKKKEDSGGTSVRGSSGGRDPRAMQAPSTSYASTDVKLLVRDAHTRAILWAGTEPAKEAFRDSKTEENLEAAAQKLVQKLRDRVEPAQ